jgi:putative glutamine amidotransferase
MDNHETLKATIEMIDGLILTGGPDICPRLYGEESICGIGEIDHALDLMQLEAVREADRKRIPTLGICRGIQTIALALGGTLYQDIRAQVKSNLDHLQKADKGVNTHRVTITNPSKLFQIVGTETLWVNSRHHQAVRTLPPDLVATAKSSDDLIEAIEKPNHPFLLGVQWHPEGTFTQDEASQKLFAALVTAAKESPDLSKRGDGFHPCPGCR